MKFPKLSLNQFESFNKHIKLISQFESRKRQKKPEKSYSDIPRRAHTKTSLTESEKHIDQPSERAI